MTQASIYKLRNNLRFYILVTTIVISVFVAGILRMNYQSDQLYFIRVQQAYGLLSIIYLYLAMIVSPLGYLIGKEKLTLFVFARRSIGVSAFYFAALHATIAVFAQFGGIKQLLYLPSLFQISLLCGLVALLILLAMAVTSFDKVIRVMTFIRWKWLHRLIYIGGLLILFHVWSVASHLVYPEVRLAAAIALITLIGLELYRATVQMNEKYLHLSPAERRILFVSVWIFVSLLVVTAPRVNESRYSDRSQAAPELQGEVDQ